MSTSELAAAYLHEGPPSCCRYRVCYLHELTSDHALAASTRMQSHSPRNCNFACIATLLALLSSGRAPAAVRCALYRAQARALSTLSVPTAGSLGCFFHYVPASAANCASLWLLPAPSGVGRIARGNIYQRSRLKTLPTAAKRCARRPIPDSRRIHHPTFEMSTGDFTTRDHRVMLHTSSAFTRDPSQSCSHIQSGAGQRAHASAS